MIEHPVNVILFMSNNLTLSGCQNARDGENGHLYGTMTIFIVCHNPYFLPPPPFLFQKWPNAYFIFVHLYDKFNFIVRLLFRIITCPIHFNFTATLLSRVNYNEIFVCSAEFYHNNAVERLPSIVVFEGRCWHANTALLFP